MSKKIKVILLKQEAKLGQKGDMIEVSPGYARNYLIPKQIAILATPDALQKKAVEQRRLTEEKQKEISLLKPILEKISQEGIEFTELVNENGQLFGSINEESIKKRLLQKYNLHVGSKELKITLNSETKGKNTIRHVGVYSVTLSFPQFPNLQVKFPITVRALKR